MYSYTELSVALNEIATRTHNASKRITSGAAQFAEALGELTTMEAQYAPVCTAIDEALAAEPANPALASLKAQKDLLMADRAAAKVKAQAYKSAIEAIQ